MNYLKYTCTGGPLDGITFGPFPQAGVKDAPDIPKMLDEASTLCAAWQRRGQAKVYGQARYKIAPAGEGYSATHVPSSDDVYFPPAPAAPAPTPPPQNISDHVQS